jgi:HEAT repeat protein
VLRDRLSDADESVRLNAALDLADAADPAGISVLLDALGHEWPAVRSRFARRALIGLGDGAIPELERASGARDPLVALGAAVALGQIDPARRPDALRGLQRALAAGGSACQDALVVLWEDGDGAALLRRDLLAVMDGEGDGRWQTDARALAALLLAGEAADWPPAQGAFLRALDSDVAAVSRGGAVALGHAGKALPEAVDRLEALTAGEGEEMPVCMGAIYALARVGEPDRAVAVLQRALGSRAAGLRVAAVRILGELGAMEPLFEPSDDMYSWLSSAHAVGTVPAERVSGLVAGALDDDDPNVRRNAILALSWLGVAARPAIARLKDELERPYFGLVAAEALARIDGRPLERPVDPDDFYPQVPIEWTDAKRGAFERLFNTIAATDGVTNVDYDLPYPKYEFLRYLSDTRRLMLHGSDRSDLELLKPLRNSSDVSDWGNVSGVYAERDPIRPIYFAVVDRHRSFGLINGCFAVADDGSIDSRFEDVGRPRHFRLSVGFPAVGEPIWREGSVYALPGETFEFWEEWTSRVPVRPVFRLAVSSDDLPLAVSYVDIRKGGSPWVDVEAPFPYLDDVWSVPVRGFPHRRETRP